VADPGMSFDHERGRLIRVVVADAQHTQRPIGGQRDLVALPPANYWRSGATLSGRLERALQLGATLP